jgi:hypothetical protein
MPDPAKASAAAARGKITVKAARWPATPFGICVAFSQATHAPCKTVEDFEHATEVRNKLRDLKNAYKADFDAMPEILKAGKDEEFDEALARFDDGRHLVVLTVGAWRWLKPMLESVVLSGVYAETRALLVASVAAATECDVEASCAADGAD